MDAVDLADAEAQLGERSARTERKALSPWMTFSDRRGRYFPRRPLDRGR
jgi:hypothetical protein